MCALLQRTAVRSNGEKSAGVAPAGACERPSSTPATQSALTLILPSVSVPVLSVQITSVEPSVSTAVSRLTRARRAAIRRTPPARDSVIVGSSPSGTFATSSPTANVTAASSESPASVVPAAKNSTPGDDGDRRDQPGDAVDLALKRTDLGPHSLGERSDPAELRRHRGRVHDRLRLAADAERAREDDVLGLEQRRRALHVARRIGCDTEEAAMSATSTPPSTVVEPIRRFAELGKVDVDFAGGKGANLGELTRAGLPVPPGFVIGAPAYEAFCDRRRPARPDRGRARGPRRG